ncbi:MAG: hypothetical protein K9L17_10045 [Clostridiales bacterium]|nr:hypothetical protein [Clostridiales bacterium]MCF8023021.1 hypothetical protein [Clostridiales bacterium]
MKKRYKLLFAIITALMILTLAACSSSGGEEVTSGNEGTEPYGEKNSEGVSITDMFKQAKTIKGMSYDYICTDHMSGNIIKGSMWMQENKQKIKAAGPSGQEVIYINDGDKGIAYAYMSAQKMAFKIDVGKMPRAEDPVDYINQTDAASASYLGTETYNGIKCYKFSAAGGENADSKVTMWLHGDYGMPLKVEVVNAGEKVMTTEFKNLQVGELDESMFNLPEGVQLQDMGEMLKEFQNAVP